MSENPDRVVTKPFIVVNTSFSNQIKGLKEPVSLVEYLCTRFPYHKRQSWVERIGQGRLTINGQIVNEKARIRSGDKLVYFIRNHREPKLPSDWMIIHHANDLAFVHKPPDLPVHRTGSILKQTLVNFVRDYFEDEKWHPVNRLDRETSGIILFAKANQVVSLSPENCNWQKLYMGIVNPPPIASKGTIEFPLGEKKGSAIRCKMHYSPSGKSSITNYQVMHRQGDKALVALRPVTGRKHQIRAHCQQIASPIIGDKIYSHEGKYYLKRISTGDLIDDDFQHLGASHHLLHCFYTEIKSVNHHLKASDFEFPKEFFKYFSREMIVAHAREALNIAW